jgi:hypothetical protein
MALAGSEARREISRRPERAGAGRAWRLENRSAGAHDHAFHGAREQRERTQERACHFWGCENAEINRSSQYILAQWPLEVSDLRTPLPLLCAGLSAGGSRSTHALLHASQCSEPRQFLIRSEFV